MPSSAQQGGMLSRSQQQGNSSASASGGGGGSVGEGEDRRGFGTAAVPATNPGSTANPGHPHHSGHHHHHHGSRHRRHSQEHPHPIYHLSSASEKLQDFAGIDFDSAQYGNVVSLVDAITPRVYGSMQNPYLNIKGAVESSFSLRDMWQALRCPYGVQVPLQHAQLNPFKAPERAVFYSPTLSGAFLTFADGVTPERRAELVSATGEQSTSSGSGCAMPPSGAAGGGGRRYTPSSRIQRNSSSTPIPEGLEFPASKESASESENLPRAWPPGIYLAEDSKPEMRLPLIDQIERLARGDYPGLVTAKNTEFTHSSWFAVLWQPIYCQNHTPQRSAGNFLAFYLVRPPPLRQASRTVFRCDRALIDPPLWLTSDEAFADMLYRNLNPSPTEGTSQPPSTVSQLGGTAPLVDSADIEGEVQALSSAGSGGTCPSTEGGGCGYADSQHSGAPTPTVDQADGCAYSVTSSSRAGVGSYTAGNGGYADSTGSRDSGEGSAPLVVPLFALVPQRARSDIWYTLARERDAISGPTYIAPLFLLATAVQLMGTMEHHFGGFSSAYRLEDFYHSLRHDKLLNDMAMMA